MEHGVAEVPLPFRIPPRPYKIGNSASMRDIPYFSDLKHYSVFIDSNRSRKQTSRQAVDFADLALAALGRRRREVPPDKGGGGNAHMGDARRSIDMKISQPHLTSRHDVHT